MYIVFNNIDNGVLNSLRNTLLIMFLDKRCLINIFYPVRNRRDNLFLILLYVITSRIKPFFYRDL